MENSLYARRLGIGDDVEVLRAPAEKEVPDRPSDDVGLMAILSETLDNAQSIGVQTTSFDAVL
jgi:hypothetical protein